MNLSSSRNNLCFKPYFSPSKSNSKSARLGSILLTYMSPSTRSSALATIFNIRQPRRPTSNQIHLGIPVKDTPSYRDVGTQTDPEPDSSHFVASKSKPGVSPPRKTRNTSGMSHRPHQIVTRKKKNASFPSKDKKANQKKKKEAVSSLKRKTKRRTNKKTKKEPTNPLENLNPLNPKPMKTSSTNTQSETSTSPSTQSTITLPSPQNTLRAKKQQNS